MTQRQAQILAAIVKEYSETGTPVASLDLAKKYNFDISPATIRNEMVILEDEGYITQPHTSAGRIPTDAGYRYFVNKLMKHLELSSQEQLRLQEEIRKLQKQYLELGQGLAKLLAQKTEGAAFALLPQGTSAAGLSNVIEQSSSVDEMKEMAHFLDELEERGQSLVKTHSEEVETLIAPSYSLLVRRVRLPGGDRGVIGIVGPKRMKYARNISLLEYVSKFLAGGLVLLMVVKL